MDRPDSKYDPSLFEEPDLPGEVSDDWINQAEYDNTQALTTKDMENALLVAPEPTKEYYEGFPV